MTKASLCNCLQRYRQSLIGLKLDGISLIIPGTEDLRNQWSLALHTLFTVDWKIENLCLFRLLCGTRSNMLLLGKEDLRDIERSIVHCVQWFCVNLGERKDQPRSGWNE